VRIKIKAPEKEPLRTAYAVSYCLLYGLLPVFWWGAKDWRVAVPLVGCMAVVQMLFFYVSAKFQNRQSSLPGRFARLAWLLTHGCLLAGYFFCYYKFAVAHSLA